MNGNQRKFLLVSAAAHGLLAVLLMLGPAFMPKRKSPLVNTPVLHVIPSQLVMEAIAGGGNPEEPVARPPQESAPPPTPARESRPIQPDPPKEQPAPSQVRTAPDLKTETKPAPKPEPRKIVVEPRPLKKREGDVALAAREREVEDRLRRQKAAAEAIENRIAETVSGIKHGLSESTQVSIPGTGGPAVASYDQAVQSLYYQNWLPPTTLADDRAAVVAEVQVNHDGRILRDRIVKPSGNRVLDDSVQAALDRVRARGLPRFPAEMKAQGLLQKTFRINFDLRSKLRFG